MAVTRLYLFFKAPSTLWEHFKNTKSFYSGHNQGRRVREKELYLISVQKGRTGIFGAQ